MIQTMQDSAGAEPKIRQSQVEEQIRALEVNAEDLEKMVMVVENHLRSVIQPLPERANGKIGTLPSPRPVLVPLADKLDAICSHFRSSVDRLRELNAVIELTE